MLILSQIHSLASKSIDFTLAYSQADIKTSVYLYPPQGIELAGGNHRMVLKLKKNLYGLKNAGRTWWEHLSSGLSSLGFVPSESDPCVWIKNDVIIVSYVDDCLVFSNDKRKIKETLDKLKNQGFVFTDEGSIEQYLGIQIENNSDGSITMSQPFLLKRIIEALPGLKDTNPANIPALSTVMLTKDKDGKPRKGT